MKPWLVFLVSCVATLGAACLPAAPANDASHLVPFTAFTEAQDEWLHDHCTPTKVVTAISHADGDSQLRAMGANFGEIVYDDGALHAVAFACPNRPEWSPANDWVRLDAK